MNAQHPTKISMAIGTAYPESGNNANAHPLDNGREPPLPVYTVRQFSARNPAYTESALRNLIYKAEPQYYSKGAIPGNGLLEAGAIIRQGRKVLIHEPRFFAWLDSANAGSQK